MQSKQLWDKEKGGVIGEYDEVISSVTGKDSWLDDTVVDDAGSPSQRKVAIATTRKEINRHQKYGY